MHLHYAVARSFRRPSSSWSALAIAVAFIAMALSSAAFYLWDRHGSGATPSTVSSAPPPILPVVARFTPAPAFSGRQQQSVEEKRNANLERLLAEARQRELAAQEKAAFADRMRRVAEEMKRATIKAAGVNRPVPVDQDDYVPMPGGGVWVTVHDNDETGLDVWINHERRRQVPKEVVTSPSATDETLIYSNGSASLFYVSQTSAGLNHCLLRVREN